MDSRPVLLTGASGLLGQWLIRTAPATSNLTALTFRHTPPGITSAHADLRDAASTASAVAELRPSVIVHAAYAMDRASIVDATQHVVTAAAQVGARVIFVSSDMVFCGDGRRRSEDSPLDTLAEYGAWKRDAEAMVRDQRGHIVVRLPLLVSLDPDDHMVRRIRTGTINDPTQWYVDEYRQPVRAAEAAAAIWHIADLGVDDAVGCWHLPGPERLSRFAIAQRLVDALGFPRTIIERADRPRGRDRPADIVLGDDRARATIDWNPTPIP